MHTNEQKNRYKNGTLTLEELMEALEDQKKVFRTTPDQLFGYILFLFRNEMGLNQESMGQLLGGTSKSTYNKLENGIHAPHFSHIFLLCNLTKVPRTFIYEIYEYLTDFTLTNGGLIRLDDDTFLETIMNENDFSEFKKNMEGKLKENSTPLKEYSAFFGFQVIDKLSKAIKKAIEDGKKS